MNITVTITYLFFRIRLRYLLRHETGELLVLYQLRKKGEKRVISFNDIYRDKEKVGGIKVLDLYKIIYPGYRSKDSAFYYLNRKNRFHLNIGIMLGTGDAYATALICGWLLALGGSVCAVLTQKNKIFRFTAKPEYNRLFFSLILDCIIAITPANIILGYFIYKNKARGKKNASD